MNAVTKLNPDQFLDPRWRIANLYRITDKSGAIVPFRPNWAQQELLDQMHNRNLVLKARQLGITTLMALVELDACIFTPNTRAAIIAHRLDDAKVIFRDKVKFAFDQLDEGLKSAVFSTQESADTLTLSNNSSFRVSTSTRSGTLQWLHISEYGKICAQFPDKAQEILTGAIPSAEQGVITIESTAEGADGDFFEKSMAAISAYNMKRELTRLDYKFFFFPWWREPKYRLPQSVVPSNPDDNAYFEKLEREIREETANPVFSFTQSQKNWWLKQEQDLGGMVKREYPGTAREAFEQAIDGAYFADQIASAEKHGRIGKFPVDPRYPVNTFWDLGRNDLTTIWLEQDIDAVYRFVGYYENSDEWIGHYIQWLKEWQLDHGISYGKHYLPHDGDRQSLWLPDGTAAVMSSLRFNPTFVPRVSDKMEAINITRRKFSLCQFDETACAVGIKGLKMFRRDWNDRLGVWSDRPRHDINSHRADSLITFATSGHVPEERAEKRRERYRTIDRRRAGYMRA
jgi:hypothetical protein